MNWLRAIEIMAGLYYFVFGVDGFFKKIPLPPPSEKGLRFLVAIEDSGYILPAVKIIEIVVGVFWIMGFGSGLAWLIFTPILFNIVAFHLFLNKQERILPFLLLSVHCLLGLKNYEFLVSVIRLSFAFN
ncbi:MAG: hypothetical protein RJB66_1745 [Pseudomonadota bacterium]